MLEKTKGFVSKHKKTCVGICAMVPSCIAICVAYRLGCQHGVNTVQKVLTALDYSLCEQVDSVFRENGVF